jgi:hypothetical protein
VDVPDIVLDKGGFCALMQALNALAVDGAQLEDVVHRISCLGYRRFHFSRPVIEHLPIYQWIARVSSMFLRNVGSNRQRHEGAPVAAKLGDWAHGILAAGARIQHITPLFRD